MIEEVISCSRELSLVEHLKKCGHFKVNSLIVMDNASGKMLGIVKPKLISKVKDKTTKVEDIMIRDFAFATPEDSVVDILRVIEENNISEIPVIDDQGKILGLVTQSTLITTLSEQYIEEEVR